MAEPVPAGSDVSAGTYHCTNRGSRRAGEKSARAGRGARRELPF